MAFGSEENYTDNGGEGKKVDFDEVNKYVVDTAQLTQRETLIGYVAAIVDLGIQEMPDAEYEFKGTPEQEEEEIVKYPGTYFKNGFNDKKQAVRLKCYPQKPQKAVTLAIDFPEVIVDKGQFFGDSKPLPLRIWMGGQFYIPDAGMVVGRPIPLKVGKNTKNEWSLNERNTLYKMAVGAKLINPGDKFLPQDIDKLLGKALQFEAQVFFKENKGKKYFTEYVAYKTGLSRGQVAPEIKSNLIVVEFGKPNSDEGLCEIRSHIVNTMKRASNFAGSVIEKQLTEKGRLGKKQESQSKEDVPEQKPEAPAQKTTPPQSDKIEDMLDDDPFDPDKIPF